MCLSVLSQCPTLLGPGVLGKSPFARFGLRSGTTSSLILLTMSRDKRSKLDRLPVELLEDILVQSGNANFARAYPRALTGGENTDLVKERLIMQALAYERRTCDWTPMVAN